MDAKEIAKKLTEIHAAYVEKIGKQPYISISLEVRQSGNCHVGIYHPTECKRMETVVATSIAKCLELALEYISFIPDPEIAAKQNWQKKLGDVIDEGNGLGLPDDVMKPLHAGSQAMAKNLLTHEKVAAE